MSKTGFFGYSVLALLVFIWGANALNTHRVRYQITVEVDTPQGVRSGAGMVQVTTWNSEFMPLPGRYSVEEFVQGEAAFVDLGSGKSLVALLASGPKAEGVDWTRYVRQAFDKAAVSDSWNVLSPQRASMVLPPKWQPTLVTFTDIANPASARVVPATAQGFESSFGVGYGLRSITLQYVDPGLRITHIWPFNQLPLAWPRWLFGEPITRGIEQRLPLLVTHREKLRRIRDDLPARFQPHFHFFVREGF
jgi:hypothetical protein